MVAGSEDGKLVHIKFGQRSSRKRARRRKRQGVLEEGDSAEGGSRNAGLGMVGTEIHETGDQSLGAGRGRDDQERTQNQEVGEKRLEILAGGGAVEDQVVGKCRGVSKPALV